MAAVAAKADAARSAYWYRRIEPVLMRALSSARVMSCRKFEYLLLGVERHGFCAKRADEATPARSP
jgi:hypothetical protein